MSTCTWSAVLSAAGREAHGHQHLLGARAQIDGRLMFVDGRQAPAKGTFTVTRIWTLTHRVGPALQRRAGHAGAQERVGTLRPVARPQQGLT